MSRFQEKSVINGWTERPEFMGPCRKLGVKKVEDRYQLTLEKTSFESSTSVEIRDPQSFRKPYFCVMQINADLISMYIENEAFVNRSIDANLIYCPRVWHFYLNNFLAKIEKIQK